MREDKARYTIDKNGRLQWGPGGSQALDLNFYRADIGVGKTDNSLHVGADFRHLGSNLGFFGSAPVTRPVVSGSKRGNDALASLLSGLAKLGLVTDSSTG